MEINLLNFILISIVLVCFIKWLQRKLLEDKVGGLLYVMIHFSIAYVYASLSREDNFYSLIWIAEGADLIPILSFLMAMYHLYLFSKCRS